MRVHLIFLMNSPMWLCLNSHAAAGLSSSRLHPVATEATPFETVKLGPRLAVTFPIVPRTAPERIIHSEDHATS